MAQASAIRIRDPQTRDRGLASVTQLMSATILASLLAVASTAAFFSLTSAAGFVDQRVALPSVLGPGPLSLASVSATAALATLAAGVLLGALARWTRRPLRNFRVVATVLAALSLSMPATISGPSLSMRLAMAGMHVIVWAVSVAVLTRLATRPVRAAA